jgi:peptidoglycan/xylan/chitin deacetylase (PgdA/CDA1 family)
MGRVAMSTGAALKDILAALLPRMMLTRGPRRSSRIALTFDDGPHAENTPRILDLLDEARATATFFLQADLAEARPDLVREMFARGHQIGNHGYQHLDAKKAPLRAYVENAQRAQRILDDILGRRLDRIFRPPYGSITGPSLVRLSWAGFRFIFWSVDSRDSFIRDPSALAEHVRSLGVAGGDIVLFHEDYAHTLKALPSILKSLRERSLEFAPIKSM